MRDVLDKVLAEPIRPHFAIANVGSAFPLFEVLKIVCDHSLLHFYLFLLQKIIIIIIYLFVFVLETQVSKKLGPRTPMIISTASGISGRDAITDEFKEVQLCVLLFLAFCLLN